MALCPLPFPDRFHRALALVENRPDIESNFDTDTRLVLYALKRQAKDGPCKDPRPWAWDAVAAAKWTTYNALGPMIVPEAWRLYVKTLDDALPNWWELAEKEGAPADGPGAGAAAAAPASPAGHAANGHHAENRSEGGAASTLAASPGGRDVTVSTPAPALSAALGNAALDVWTPVEGSGAAPRARFEHACAIVGTALYIVSGNAGGRCLADVHVLDLLTLTWRELVPSVPEGTPQPRATAGHTLTAVGSCLVMIGGYARGSGPSKDGRIEAWQLDTNNHAAAWRRIDAAGDAPPARACHTTCRLGSRLYVYGGEDAGRRVVGDLHYLDLSSAAHPRWIRVDDASGSAPPARAGHTACACGTGDGAEMVVFGGGTRADVFADAYAFRAEPPRWERLETSGPPPEPRSGHAATLVAGRYWFIAGGGNGAGGVATTRVLDLARRKWLSDAAATVAPNHPVASEGLCLIAVGGAADGTSVLLAFGGYNGRTHAKVHALLARIPSTGDDGDAWTELRARIAELEAEVAQLRRQPAV